MTYHSPFFDFIPHVVERSTKKQVGRIDTSGGIAMVAHKHTVRDGTEMQLVGNSVWVQRTTAKGKGTISPLGRTVASQEEPTFVGATLVYGTPKPFLKSSIASGLGLVVANVLLGFASNPTILATRRLCNRRGLSTTTHAQSIGVGARFVKWLALQLGMMTGYVTKWLTFDPSGLFAGHGSNGRKFTTATHTESARVRRGRIKNTIFLGVMPDDVSLGFAFDPSGVSVCSWGDRRKLTASAMAITVGNFVRGTISHVDTFLSRFGHATGRFQSSRWRFLLGCCHSIIPQLEQYGNHVRVGGVGPKANEPYQGR